MLIDPLYLLMALPGFLLAAWAQWRVRSAFGRYSRVPTSRGLSGSQVAAAVLRLRGITGVDIEPTRGLLSDHYDPRSRTLRLSPDVYQGRSVAAAGVAAHEVGHAIQHAQGYRWLAMRSALVPVVGITSRAAMPTIFVGFILMTIGMVGLGQVLFKLGALLFAGLVVFQLVTLPVEIDASRRALAAIEEGRLVTGQELVGARRVLRAAAYTYIAAAISSLLTLLYFLLRAGLLGSRD